MSLRHFSNLFAACVQASLDRLTLEYEHRFAAIVGKRCSTDVVYYVCRQYTLLRRLRIEDKPRVMRILDIARLGSNDTTRRDIRWPPDEAVPEGDRTRSMFYDRVVARLAISRRDVSPRE